MATCYSDAAVLKCCIVTPKKSFPWYAVSVYAAMVTNHITELLLCQQLYKVKNYLLLMTIE